MLLTQPPVRMAPSFQLLKISFFAEYTHNQPYLLLQVPLMAKHLPETNNITILAAVSLDVERTAPSSAFFLMTLIE